VIRENAPIALIPAAWAVTFGTMIYPGIDTYWIQHMHYFILLFLSGFTVLSWKEMGKDHVLDIWRKVIGAGIIFTGMGALSFTLTEYSFLLGLSSISYWFLAPGIALFYSSKQMKKYSGLYGKLGSLSITAFVLFILGIYTFGPIKEFNIILTTALASIALIQTASIITASKLDS
jgi:hypothetical protein